MPRYIANIESHIRVYRYSRIWIIFLKWLEKF